MHLGNLINLSEQQLIDCNMQCWGCDGCSGATKAMEFLIFTNGSIFESGYPYESGTTGAAKRMKNYKTAVQHKQITFSSNQPNK